jgi:hypothetical protein
MFIILSISNDFAIRYYDSTSWSSNIFIALDPLTDFEYFDSFYIDGQVENPASSCTFIITP